MELIFILENCADMSRQLCQPAK